MVPFWLTFWKHDVVTDPLHVGKNGSPYVLLQTSRSALAVGSSYASTIAILWFPAVVIGSEYAPWN
jgi:hypothetical protein